MRFIVDASTGMAVAKYLQDVGHDVVAVPESMPHAPDHEILERASNESRIIVTNDKDFGELVFRDELAHFGVILLRLDDEYPTNRVAVIAAVIENYAEQLPGHFVVVTQDKVRIRPNPFE